MTCVLCRLSRPAPNRSRSRMSEVIKSSRLYVYPASQTMRIAIALVGSNKILKAAFICSWHTYLQLWEANVYNIHFVRKVIHLEKLILPQPTRSTWPSLSLHRGILFAWWLTFVTPTCAWVAWFSWLYIDIVEMTIWESYENAFYSFHQACGSWSTPDQINTRATLPGLLLNGRWANLFYHNCDVAKNWAWWNRCRCRHYDERACSCVLPPCPPDLGHNNNSFFI